MRHPFTFGGYAHSWLSYLMRMEAMYIVSEWSFGGIAQLQANEWYPQKGENHAKQFKYFLFFHSRASVKLSEIIHLLFKVAMPVAGPYRRGCYRIEFSFLTVNDE